MRTDGSLQELARKSLLDIARMATNERTPEPALAHLLHVVLLLNGDVSDRAQQIRGLVSVFQTFKLVLAANQIQAICAGVVALLEAPGLPSP